MQALWAWPTAPRKLHLQYSMVQSVTNAGVFESAFLSDSLSAKSRNKLCAKRNSQLSFADPAMLAGHGVLMSLPFKPFDLVTDKVSISRSVHAIRQCSSVRGRAPGSGPPRGTCADSGCHVILTHCQRHRHSHSN
jgi:hypothetical protein